MIAMDPETDRLMRASCTCDELVVGPDVTPAANARVHRILRVADVKLPVRLAAPPGHNCHYVKARNALIPVAWYAAGQGAKSELERSEKFHREMDRLVRELHRKGMI